MKKDVIVAVERILDNYLEMNNHRKTPERYAILRAIYSTKGHFTLEELSEKLKGDLNFPVSRATLYNTLNLFLELRLIMRHRFQGTTKYETSYHNSGHCHQTCTVCGKVSEVRSPAIAQTIESLHLPRFRKDGFSLYIYGVCSSCQTKLTRQQRQNQKKKTNETNKNQKK